MVDFLGRRRRRKLSFKERIQNMTTFLNEKRELHYIKVALDWGIGPDYCRKLMRWTAQYLPYAEFDEETGMLSMMTVSESNGIVPTEEVVE